MQRAGTDPIEPTCGDLELRWLRRDPGAFREAHTRYRSRLEAVAYRIVRSHAIPPLHLPQMWCISTLGYLRR